jgi:hypothetical protein
VCPICSKDTASERLKFGGKSCYMAHCRFLRQGHIWHIKKIKKIKKKKKKLSLTVLRSIEWHIMNYLEINCYKN